MHIFPKKREHGKMSLLVVKNTRAKT
jgi:hypothetical protein